MSRSRRAGVMFNAMSVRGLGGGRRRKHEYHVQWQETSDGDQSPPKPRRPWPRESVEPDPPAAAGRVDDRVPTDI